MTTAGAVTIYIFTILNAKPPHAAFISVTVKACNRMVMIGSKYAMPMVVLNLGGEMIYILNQRLQAQNIADEKSRKVLQDVVKAMFSSAFIEELFKPQQIYTLTSTKQIFEKLAHSSIMRLNQSSMDKLFDLMTMGFKYQLLQCSCPQQYLHILLVHLESIKDLLGRGAISDLAQTAIDLAIQTYSTFTISNWIQLKGSILKLVQGKRIKVSLFLQHRMQGLDGNLVLDFRGKLPHGTDVPGDVSFYENSRQVFSKRIAVEFDESIVAISSSVIDVESSIGGNMYLKGFHPDVKVLPGPVASSVHALSVMEGVSGHKRNFSSSMEPRNKSVAKMELKILSDMLGLTIGSSDDKSSIPWRVNLFPELASDSKSSEGGSYDSNFIRFDIDGSADSKSMNDYLEKLDFNIADSKTDQNDDLLSLFDNASK